jgi:hypothetical protein
MLRTGTVQVADDAAGAVGVGAPGGDGGDVGDGAATLRTGVGVGTLAIRPGGRWRWWRR